MTSANGSKGRPGVANPPPPADEDVKLPKKGTFNFGALPRCMYFYYIGPYLLGEPGYDASNPRKRKIRHYYHADRDVKIDYDATEQLIIELTHNARKPELNQIPPPDGADLKYLVWTRKSYIAFVVDEPDVDFDYDNPIIFNKDVDGKGERNHTFFDGWSKPVYIPNENGVGGVSRPVVCFINHMKRRGGSDLDYEGQYFHFVLGDGGIWIRQYPDSGGTNMGPPVPPP